MFEAKGIDFSQIPDLPSHYEASAPGVGFAAGGGVAKAVEEVIHRLHPEVEVKTAAAEGLNECRRMLRIARTGKYDGYLLEGMACPGGCIAGAGTVQPPEKSRRALEKYKAAVSISNPMDSQYLEGPACCTKTKRTGTAWVGIDEFGVQKERKRSRWGAFARCDEDGGGSRRVPPRFDRVRCYNGRQQSARRQPGGGGMGV